VIDDVAGWDAIADWWLGEVADDPCYREQVLPLLGRLLGDAAGPVLDLGCGEGQGMRYLGGDVLGCDLSARLLRRARRAGPVVRCRLPDLSWLVDGAVAAAYSVFVLDLLADLDGFFREAARVTRRGGPLVVVVNHPAFTPHDAGPIVDLDGEVLWRWGRYLAEGTSLQPAGSRRVRFHHRPLGRILTGAAAAGWCLEELEEQALGPAVIAREPGYHGQEGIPRILGVRWRRRDG